MLRSVQQNEPIEQSQKVFSQIGEVQNDVWLEGSRISSAKELNNFSKNDLMDIYNRAATANGFKTLTSTWKKKTKGEVLNQLLPLLQGAIELVGPPKVNTASIPRIAKDTFVFAELGSGYSALKTYAFGKVKEQKADGNLVINRYKTEKVSTISPCTTAIRPTQEFVYEIIAKPEPDNDHWDFVSKVSSIDIMFWRPWNGNFDQTYIEEYDMLK